MKLAVLFLILTLSLYGVESQPGPNNVFCVEKANVLNMLEGREGPAGITGPRGEPGPPGDDAFKGPSGDKGEGGYYGSPGEKGSKGAEGHYGMAGRPGRDGDNGDKGAQGDEGMHGYAGVGGDSGKEGRPGPRGDQGPVGLDGAKIRKDILLSLLNDYYVVESGYFKNTYHVTSRALTDGRSDTGGWGSKTEKIGNYIQATYLRPVYVTSVTVSGGRIPSWGHEVAAEYGDMHLEYSKDGKTWTQVVKIKNQVTEEMITHTLSDPVTAKYWRLISTEDKWVGTTEFALNPLVKED